MRGRELRAPLSPIPQQRGRQRTDGWTRRITHTGDSVGYYELDQRFEHPGRTWASAAHACVGAAMANEMRKSIQSQSKVAMKQVLDIKNEAAHMKGDLSSAPL